MSEIINETINELNKPTPNNIFSIEDDPVTILEKINQVERYLKQIDTSVDTSINTANEALEKANNAFEANGTLVKINGENQLTWSADFAESERQKSKNLIPYPFINSSSTANGITFKVNADQSITANGTISDNSTNAVMYLNYGLLIEAGTYTLSATKSIEDDNFIVSLFDGTNYYDTNSTFTLTEPKTINVYVQIRKSSTSTYTNANIKVMLCKGTDTDWQPYNGSIVHQIDIAPVVLYDKNSTDPNINSGKTSGIQIGESITRELSGYKKLKVYIRRGYVAGIAECDISDEATDFSYVGLEVNLQHTIYATIQVIGTQILFKSGGTQYINRDSYSKADIETASTNFIIYRIEGVK